MTNTSSPSPIKVIALTLLAIVILVGIALGAWAFKVATSDIKGRGDATVQKNSATNRVSAQERFEDLYQEVITADQRIDTAAAAVKDDPSTVNNANLTGAISYCIDVRGDYNAEARKYGSEDFRAYDLPEQIDPISPTTDCKETTTR